MVEEKNKTNSRLIQSAEKKLNFQLPGTPYTFVSNGALNYEATERIRSLSQPRLRKEFQHCRPDFSARDYDPNNSCVYNKAALTVECSDRIYRLSSAKSDYKDYKFARTPYTSVTPAAQNATASFRIEMMCIPLKRKQCEKYKYEAKFFD